MIDPLRLDLELRCDAEHAFEVWTRRTSAWWPASHSMSGAAGLVVTIDVLITFSALGADRCRVAIDHRGWERLGTDGEDWRDANRGGWAGLLPHFVADAER